MFSINGKETSEMLNANKNPIKNNLPASLHLLHFKKGNSYRKEVKQHYRIMPF